MRKHVFRFISSFVMTSTLIFAGCESPSEGPPNEAPVSLQAQGATSPLPEVKTGCLYGKGPVSYVMRGEWAVVGGDMLFRPEELACPPETDPPIQSLGGVTGITAAFKKWPYGVVPYVIDPALPQQDRVQEAIRHWHTLTSIRFVPKTSETDYILFTPEPTGVGASFSYVGMTGGLQKIWISKGANTKSVAHEMGHAIGLFHQHQSPYRDRHIKVHLDRVEPAFVYAFDKLPHVEAFDITSYDYQSIMHYPAEAFSKDWRPTIERLDGGFAIGGMELSEGDVRTVEQMYGPFIFSHKGKIPGYECTLVKPPGETSVWDDNYLCVRDIGFPIKFSLKSVPDPTSTCLKLEDPSDSHASASFLCYKGGIGFTLSFSHRGPIGGKKCIQFYEPDDSSWTDNYLCYDETLLSWKPYLPLPLGSPLSVICTSLYQPGKAAIWALGKLCFFDGSPTFRFVHGTPPSDSLCTLLDEPMDSTWKDNYLCSVKERPLRLTWVNDGKLVPNKTCVQIYEPDPDTGKPDSTGGWDNNYLCY